MSAYVIADITITDPEAYKAYQEQVGATVEQFGGRLEVPHGFDELTLIRHPRVGELCSLRFYYLGRDERHSRFNFIVYGDDMQPIIVAHGYRTVLIAERF